MTQKAREVLRDCQVALQLLEDETQNDRWRIHWAAAVALIRAVGHVLDKVDGQNPNFKRAAKEAYQRWKSEDQTHEIFREFIERERNNLLKEYHSDVHPDEMASLLVQLNLQPLSGGRPITTSEVYDLNESIYKPMLDGPWKDDDARDVLTAAIQWWEQELSAIDIQANLYAIAS